MAKTEREKRETLARIAREKEAEREDRARRFTQEMNAQPKKQTRVILRDMAQEDSEFVGRMFAAGMTPHQVTYVLKR